MKKTTFKTNFSAAGKILLAALAVCASVLMCIAFFLIDGGGRYALKADAYQSPKIAVRAYDVQITIKENRKIEVEEQITVEFLQHGLTMFYRSLPIDEGDMYENIQASCQKENTEFSYYVADNEEIEGFLDICCVGAAEKGNVWTYNISYVQTIGVDDVENGMILDVIGAGWPVALHDVSVTVNFPARVQSYQLYSGEYGSKDKGDVTENWSADKKQVILTTDVLPVEYNGIYSESMARAITLEFVLPEGALQNFTATQMLTKDMGTYIVFGILSVALAVAARIFFKGKEILTPIVNLKAPKNMDPMQMGLHIDGMVDGEDVTSMIYYFAAKGYLMINLEDEKDPILIRKMVNLPNDASAYETTLFDGLFKKGDSVSVAQLKNEFYQSSDQAILQVQTKKKKHYTDKSIFGFILGGIIAFLYVFIAIFFTSISRVGGGYSYMMGAVIIAPVGILLIGEYLLHSHKFKWNKKLQIAVKIALIAIAVISSILFAQLFATHFMTRYEKIVLSTFAMICPFITSGALSYTKEYNQLLGDILGFKDFIVVTEEDKIKFMLQENPELYYDVLPYAQVLGVTNEWENKFAKIVLQPPSWYVGTDVTVFDYLIFRRCMRTMSYSMLSRPQESGGVGRSGGGGRFGGFSGGGHGGGGGGAR